MPPGINPGGRNRTRMTSLEGWGSTIELHPRTEVGTSVDQPAQFECGPAPQADTHADDHSDVNPTRRSAPREINEQINQAKD